MNSRVKSKAISGLGFALVAGLVILGSIQAYTRGGKDFFVFYEAWRLVLRGQGSEIYRLSPDRFLYGPGFAWLLAPLGLLPSWAALGVWCLLKAFVLGFLINKLSQVWQSKDRLLSLGVSAWGAVLLARPLLIDFEYGQVNLLILGACLWGLLGHFETEESPTSDFARWYLLALAAIAKLFPIPLLLVPWAIPPRSSFRKAKWERIAIIAGLVTALLVPVFSQGWIGTFHLLKDWREAVLARGLPLESHNQSFTALLYHYLSGQPTPVISEGSAPLLLGYGWLAHHQIVLLSLFWTCLTFSFSLGWILTGSLWVDDELKSTQKQFPLKWIGIVVGLLIVPSHLVWKPYFVMSLPLAILVIHQASRINRPSFYFSILILFIGINLTGFDFVGHHWAAHFEAASFMLFMHLSMMAVVANGDHRMFKTVFLNREPNLRVPKKR